MTETQNPFLYGDERLGSILRQLREQKSISREIIAEALNTDIKEIILFEDGKRPISLWHLSHWLDTLEISPNLFFSLYNMTHH